MKYKLLTITKNMKIFLFITAIIVQLLVSCFYCKPICNYTSTNTAEQCPHSHQVFNRTFASHTQPYYSYLTASRGSGRVGFGGRPRHQSDKNKTRRKNSASCVSLQLVLLIILLCIYFVLLV